MTTEFFAAYDGLLARWGVPVESFEIEGEVGVTRVNACGAVDVPPLVLLAGYGAGGSPVWFGLAPRLAQYRRVYAIDLPGDAGRSTGQLGNQAELHRWLGGVLDGLAVERADLCGHSYGAWVSLSYALQSPGRVGKLALLDPTDCFAGVDPEWLSLAALAAELPATPVRPRRPGQELLQLEAELLVVVAERSRSHHPERLIGRVAELAPEASVVRLAEASHHSIPVGHPEELAAALEKFLA